MKITHKSWDSPRFFHVGSPSYLSLFPYLGRQQVLVLDAQHLSDLEGSPSHPVGGGGGEEERKVQKRCGKAGHPLDTCVTLWITCGCKRNCQVSGCPV